MNKANSIDPGPNRTEIVCQSLDPLCVHDENDLSQLLKNYRRKIESDPRHIICDLKGKIDKDCINLSGKVLFPNMASGIERLLEHRGWKVNRTTVEVMPGPSLDGKRFALVNVPECGVYRGPNTKLERVTSGLYAEPVFLLCKENEWYFGQTVEGYLGWIQQAGLATLDINKWKQWHQAEKAIIVKQCVHDGQVIPRGSILPISHNLEIILVDGRLLKADAETYRTFDSKHLDNLIEVVEIAKQYYGKPYCWGSRSKEAVDCSGFVQAVYRQIGVNLPRDASQQYIGGVIAGTPEWKENIRPGDLLFFANPIGIVGHVGIVIDGLQFIHAQSSLGVVINSLDSHDANYHEELDRNFILAKRYLS